MSVVALRDIEPGEEVFNIKVIVVKNIIALPTPRNALFVGWIVFQSKSTA